MSDPQAVQAAALADEMITVRGTYARCMRCRAPVLDPFPPGWTLTLSKVGDRTFLTPHQPSCEARRSHV